MKFLKGLKDSITKLCFRERKSYTPPSILALEVNGQGHMLLKSNHF